MHAFFLSVSELFGFLAVAWLGSSYGVDGVVAGSAL